MEIRVFSEAPDIVDLHDERITVHDLNKVPGYTEFMDATGHLKPKNYLFDARRFAHKGFAILGMMFYPPRETSRFWFVDADMVWKKKVPDELWTRLLDDVPFAHMGRAGSYTETGLLGFNRDHRGFSDLAMCYADCYQEREIFMLPAWTDCHAFDYARAGIDGRNLTMQGKGMDNVIEQSVFAPYLAHAKGPEKEKKIAQIQNPAKAGKGQETEAAA